MQKKHLAIVALLVATLFGLGLVLGLILPRLTGLGLTLGLSHYSSATLLQQVQTLSQLVTVKYIIEKVEVLEDVKWVPVLGENRVLLIAHGTVKAGVDLSKLRSEDLKLEGKKLVITLPRPEITDAYLDEHKCQIVEHSTGLLRMFDKDLEQTARQNAINDIRLAARSGGILKDAEDRARAQIRSLFGSLGFDVEVRTR
jgi:hypothetical protein